MLMRLLVSFLKKKESTARLSFHNTSEQFEQKLEVHLLSHQAILKKTIEVIKPFDVKKPIVTTPTNNEAGGNRGIFLKQ